VRWHQDVASNSVDKVGAVYHSPSSRSSKVLPISAERHLITMFHLRIKRFPELPTQTLQVSVDRQGIDTGASTSRGPHQPSTTPASASASSSSKNAVTASRQNKQKCTTPPNNPHTKESKNQRINLRRSCRQQGSSSDKASVIILLQILKLIINLHQKRAKFVIIKDFENSFAR
jgi:hypothetical protein